MAPTAEVRKTVTVVFADVTGSTALGDRLDAESLRRLISRYFARMQEVLGRHGGTVEKFIGDAVMAVFGIPELHEDDAVRAVRASAEMGQALDELNQELERMWGVRLQMRIGVNTGEVVTANAAAGQLLVTGDAVNVAARLEQAAAPGEVLLGTATHRLVRDSVLVEEVGPLTLRGKAGTVRAVRLLEVLPRTPGHVRRLDTPLVSRSEELSLIEWAYRRVKREQRSHVLTIFGAAGVGKSRLVAEAVRRLEGDAAVVQGQCPPYGEGIAFWPAAAVVRQAAGVTEEDDLEVSLAKLRSLLEPEPEAEAIVERLVELIGRGEARAPVDETAWAVRRALESLARRRPVVVVFDDLHWAEDSFLDLVDHVADWASDAPILLLCVARTELLDRRPDWGGGKLNGSSMQLEPLTASESEELLGRLLGAEELARPAAKKIVEAAEGNPLYVEEMLANLMEDGLLHLDGRCWEPTVDLSAVVAPPSIEAVLAARLDRLTPEQGNVIRRASVAGTSFTAAAVMQLSPPGEQAAIPEVLAALVRKDLLRCQRIGGQSESFSFRHSLIRDAAYASLPKQERADMHERFAAWLQQHAGAPSLDVEELLGHHLEAAHHHRLALGPADGTSSDLARQASSHLAAAGRGALARQDMMAAVNLLSRAAALGEEDHDRAELLHDLGSALAGMGRVEEAAATFASAARAAEPRGDPLLEARIRLSHLELQLQTEAASMLAAVDEASQELMELFLAAGDERWVARTWHLRASADWIRCQAGRAEAALVKAVEHARAGGDEAAEAEYLGNLTGVALFGPSPLREGVVRCREALRRAGELRSPSLEGRALRALGCMLAMQGELTEGRRLLARSIAVFEDLGLAHWLGGGYQAQGIVEELADDLVAAEKAFRRSYELLAGLGSKSFSSTAAALLANALCEAGSYEEADSLARESETWAAPDDLDTQVQWRRVRAKILVQQGRLVEAEVVAREALQLARRTDLTVHADLLVDLGLGLVAVGRADEADAVFAQALAAHERKGNRLAAERSRRALASLRRVSEADVAPR